MAGFVEFFYNIIPGALFILALLTTRGIEKLVPWTIKHALTDNDLLSGSAFVILSLFLGFTLQMVNKLIIIQDRWSKENIERIITDNKTRADFEKAKDRLRILVGENKDKDENFRFFYFIDNYVWANRHSGLTQLFHAQISLWANIMTASAIYIALLLMLSLISYPPILDFNQLQVVLALGVGFSAYCFTKKSIRRFHDTVIKTFLVVTDKKLREGF